MHCSSSPFDKWGNRVWGKSLVLLLSGGIRIQCLTPGSILNVKKPRPWGKSRKQSFFEINLDSGLVPGARDSELRETANRADRWRETYLIPYILETAEDMLTPQSDGGREEESQRCPWSWIVRSLREAWRSGPVLTSLGGGRVGLGGGEVVSVPFAVGGGGIHWRQDWTSTTGPN